MRDHASSLLFSREEATFLTSMGHIHLRGKWRLCAPACTCVKPIPSLLLLPILLVLPYLALVHRCLGTGMQPLSSPLCSLFCWGSPCGQNVLFVFKKIFFLRSFLVTNFVDSQIGPGVWQGWLFFVSLVFFCWGICFRFSPGPANDFEHFNVLPRIRQSWSKRWTLRSHL